MTATQSSGTFGPKDALGSQNNVEQVAEVSEEIWRFLKKFCEPTLSNLLPPARLFLNLATRWQPSTTDSCKTLLISRQLDKGFKTLD